MRGRIDQHVRYRELIAARLDRPLTRVELRTLNAHLKKCGSCIQIEAEYRDQRSLLRGLAPPIPPRDMWARTSSGLDRELARAYQAQRWRRRMAHGRRSAQPSTGVMAAVAAIGVTAAIAVLQLAPAIGPAASIAGRPTPLDVPPQHVSFLVQGGTDVSLYSTDVSQVCPTSGPIDCVDIQKYTRTPLVLPPDMRAGNVTLSPSGNQLALVGHYVGEDVIAVVMLPQDAAGDGTDPGAGTADGQSGSGQGGGKKGDGKTTGTDGGAGTDPQATDASGGPSAARTHAPTTDAAATPDDGGNSLGSPVAVDGPTPAPQAPATPPSSAVPGLAVLAILDNVQSAGSPPDWSASGAMLAFSAMPDDGSRGPDVYVWSPGDDKATPITSDHASFFASWSGNKIVVSRLIGTSLKPHNFVIDPRTGEERAVIGPPMWLPTVNTQRTQAVGWVGQLDTSGLLPSPRSGALYLMDWQSIDPFGAAAPVVTDAPDPPDPTPTPAVDVSPPAPSEPATTPDAQPVRTAPGNTNVPEATVQPSSHTSAPSAAPTAAATPQPTVTPTAAPTTAPTAAPTQSVAAPAPTDDPDADAGAPLSDLVPIQPDRDPRSAPVVDWQAHWSSDGEVLGVWIANSAGAAWGQLAVLAVDQTTDRVSTDNPPLAMTLARRGFSLGTNRVAWVGPSDDNVDGELRIRTWGSDGFGGLRLKAPDQEEVLPAS